MFRGQSIRCLSAGLLKEIFNGFMMKFHGWVAKGWGVGHGRRRKWLDFSGHLDSFVNSLQLGDSSCRPINCWQHHSQQRFEVFDRFQFLMFFAASTGQTASSSHRKIPTLNR